MKQSEIASMARAYGEAVRLAREAGMDAVEIHAGHGYLISNSFPRIPTTGKTNMEEALRTVCAS